MSAETILAVLSKIPWGAVVESAPKLAGAASKLWKTVTGKKAETAGLPKDGEGAGPAREAVTLGGRLSAAESRLEEIGGQMAESAELIKALAEQNALLVQKIDETRAQLVRVAAAAGIAIALAAGIILFLVLQPR